MFIYHWNFDGAFGRLTIRNTLIFNNCFLGARVRVSFLAQTLKVFAFTFYDNSHMHFSPLLCIADISRSVLVSLTVTLWHSSILKFHKKFLGGGASYTRCNFLPIYKALSPAVSFRFTFFNRPTLKVSP